MLVPALIEFIAQTQTVCTSALLPLNDRYLTYKLRSYISCTHASTGLSILNQGCDARELIIRGKKWRRNWITSHFCRFREQKFPELVHELPNNYLHIQNLKNP